MSAPVDGTPQYPARLNIAAHLAARADAAGWNDRTAQHCAGRSVSYAEVFGGAARYAAVLRELGVRREQRVLVALPDAPAFATAFLGSIWRGAVAVPVNPYLAAEEYVFFLADSRAVVAAVPPWLLEVVVEAAPELPQLRHVTVFGEPGAPDGGAAASPWRDRLGSRGGLRIHDGDALVGAAEAAAPAPTHGDEAAFWLYTSGSTGAPKGAIHLHHDIWVSAACWGEQTMGFSPSHTHLSASKLFFAYGLGNSLYCPLWTGGSAVLVPPKPTPRTMVEAMRAHAVTHFYAVPSFYNALLNDAEFARWVDAGSFATLQACVSAGETLPAPLCERWMAQVGVPLIDGIGSTELLHIFIANRLDDIRPGCSGTPIPGYDARVCDERGVALAAGEIGDLWVRGDSACAGYWNRHAATKQAVRGEWLVTGDKYRCDTDGYYWYTGRADDMFKVRGKWVSPARVESALLAHDAVAEVAVVAGVTEDGLACGVAFVVAAAPGEDLERILLEHARERLSSYLVPHRIELCERLPKTATGKIQRYRLRR